MIDTRTKAVEKAEQRLSAMSDPSTSGGFESERKKANQALRNELSTFKGEGVYKIPAMSETATGDHIHIILVL